MVVRSLFSALLTAGVVAVPASAGAAAPTGTPGQVAHVRAADARGPVLDPSFGRGGVAVADFGGGDEVTDLALAADGSIVAVGGGEQVFNLVRYRPDGRPDAAFGTGGVVSTDVDPESFSDSPTSVALRPDGRVVAGGRVTRGGSGVAALVAYLPDGTVDTSFGTGGRLYPVDPSASSRVVDLHLAPDGSLLVAVESATTDGSPPVALVKLLPSGALDPAFGDGGLVRVDLGPREIDYVTALAVAPGGDILLAGATAWWSTLPEPTADVLLVRFTPAGALDTSFGAGGRVTRDLTGPQGIDGTSGLTVAADGRIVLTTWQQVGDERRSALLRYRPDGRPDRGFGRAGVAAGPVGVTLRSPVVRPGGRILTTGTDGADLVLTRFRADGRPDPAFGRRGVLLTDVDGGQESGAVLRIDASRRLVVGGNAGSGGGTSFGVFRFLP